MPCLHKFSEDLQLQYVDWEVRTLFIGTFNPIWQSCANNYAQWFYGRTARNEFWCIVPIIHGENSLLHGNRELWIDFCKRHKIAITDIVSSFNDADEANLIHRQAICSFQDSDLIRFQANITNIPVILEAHPSIEQVIITRQTLPPFWRNCFLNTSHWIHQHPERNIQVRMLRSPSRGARRGVIGNFCEFVAGRWTEQGYEIL